MNSGATGDITTLDLDSVLEQGRPRRNQSLLAPMFIGAILLAALVSIPGDSAWVQALVPVAMALIILFAIRNASRVARQQRLEAEQLRLADEAVRLGRWEEASVLVTTLLSSPTPRQHVRIQALVYLASLLSRGHRYTDVIRLYDYLQDTAQFPPQMRLSLKCMRAYAMLRDDRLSDAYQAVTELRRESPQGSGMLSLLEMYHQVKTGHNDDALQLFEQRRGQMAEQLSHRSADAWALAATAALALSRQDQARMSARQACVLLSPAEIVQRLPECAAALELIGPSGGTAA